MQISTTQQLNKTLNKPHYGPTHILVADKGPTWYQMKPTPTSHRTTKHKMNAPSQHTPTVTPLNHTNWHPIQPLCKYSYSPKTHRSHNLIIPTKTISTAVSSNDTCDPYEFCRPDHNSTDKGLTSDSESDYSFLSSILDIKESTPNHTITSGFCSWEIQGISLQEVSLGLGARGSHGVSYSPIDYSTIMNLNH